MTIARAMENVEQGDGANAMATFPLGAVLSVTTGRLVAPFDDVHCLLDHMTGAELYTHQLPRAADACGPAILSQHPDLASVQVPDDLDGPGPVRAWLSEQVTRYGDSRDVASLPTGAYTARDPIAELLQMRPGTPVIVVAPAAEPT